MCQEKKRKNAGFTLVELIVVVAILGFLLSIAIPRYLTARTTAAQAATKANLHQLASSMELYMTEHPEVGTQYPDDPTSWLQGYIPKAPIPPAGGDHKYRYSVFTKNSTNDTYAFWDPVGYGGKYFAAGPGGVIGEGTDIGEAITAATGVQGHNITNPNGGTSLDW